MPQTPKPSPRETPPPGPTEGAAARGEGGDLHAGKLAEELALVRARLAEIESENLRMSDEFVAAQARSTDLARLYVALERIHGGRSRADTLAAVQEVVINMVGCEEFAIFERRGDALHVVESFGVSEREIRSVPVGEGAIGGAVETGRVYVAERDGHLSRGEEELTAVIPLRLGTEISGAIALFRLLSHKTGIVASDAAVFDLLSAHAGLALHLRATRDAPAAG